MSQQGLTRDQLSQILRKRKTYFIKRGKNWKYLGRKDENRKNSGIFPQKAEELATLNMAAPFCNNLIGSVFSLIYRILSAPLQQQKCIQNSAVLFRVKYVSFR